MRVVVAFLAAWALALGLTLSGYAGARQIEIATSAPDLVLCPGHAAADPPVDGDQHGEQHQICCLFGCHFSGPLGPVPSVAAALRVPVPVYAPLVQAAYRPRSPTRHLLVPLGSRAPPLTV